MLNMSSSLLFVTNLLLIILMFIISSLFLFWPYIKKYKELSIKEYIKNNKYRLVLSILLFIGFTSRIAFLDLLPRGLNQDEASSGYEAFTIMKYGIDRNGNSYPIHLVSWGSGQNVLYSYIVIPFIFIFGNNEFALRLPMAIIGCISIFLIYKLFDKFFNKKATIIALFIFIICPWHLMKSRWALESNLFPDLVFYGFYFLIYYVYDKKLYKLIISTIILGISAYSYGTSYFFLFFFVIGYLIYLLITKKISFLHSFICLSIIGTISIPIILFLYINFFDKESIKILCFTIPKLNVNRFHSVTSIYSNSFLESSFKNFKNGLFLLFNQNDNLPWNSTPYFGYMYLFSMPFTIIGVFSNDNEHKNIIWILRIWLIVSLMMLLIISPNINRINIIFFPLIIFTSIGLINIFNLSKRYEKILLPLYSASFLIFITYYSTTWNNIIKPNFFYGLKDSINYVESIYDKDKVYITPKINAPYIYVLYYTEYDVNEYISTVKFTNPGGAFESVKSFGNYCFYIPNSIIDGNIYIIRYDDKTFDNYDLSEYKVINYGYYKIIDATK